MTSVVFEAGLWHALQHLQTLTIKGFGVKILGVEKPVQAALITPVKNKHRVDCRQCFILTDQVATRCFFEVFEPLWGEAILKPGRVGLNDTRKIK